MTPPSDAKIIARALELLESGVLASRLPERLMIDYGLTPEHALRLAATAIERRRRDASQAGNGSK